MSLTGNDVLALIERTLTDTRSEIGNIDTRLARSTAELERLKQAEIGCLSVLAKMRLREIEGATVSASLDATGESVRALLAQRELAQAEVEAEIARAEERRKELEQERAAQHDVVDDAEQALDEARAAAQKALAADERYRGSDGRGRRLGSRRGSRRGKGEGRAHGPCREGQAVRRRSVVLLSMGARLRHAGVRGRRPRPACSTAG